MVVILSLGEGSLFGLSDIIEILRSLYFLRMTQSKNAMVVILNAVKNLYAVRLQG